MVPGDDWRPKLVGVMVDIHDDRRREEQRSHRQERPAPSDPDLIASSPLHQAIVDNLSDGVSASQLERRFCKALVSTSVSAHRARPRARSRSRLDRTRYEYGCNNFRT